MSFDQTYLTINQDLDDNFLLSGEKESNNFCLADDDNQNMSDINLDSNAVIASSIIGPEE